MNRIASRIYASVLVCGCPAIVQAATVTTAPPGMPAPAISGTWLAVLAAALLLFALASLRHRRLAAGLSALATMALLGAAVVEAIPQAMILVADAACSRRQTFQYNGQHTTNLVNGCTNQMAVVALDPECGFGETGEAPPQGCEEGMVLDPNEACRLPGCFAP